MTYTDCPNCAGSGVAFGKRCACASTAKAATEDASPHYVVVASNSQAVTRVEGRRFAVLPAGGRVASQYAPCACGNPGCTGNFSGTCQWARPADVVAGDLSDDLEAAAIECDKLTTYHKETRRHVLATVSEQCAFQIRQLKKARPPAMGVGSLSGLEVFRMAKKEVCHPTHHTGEFVRLADVQTLLALRPTASGAVDLWQAIETAPKDGRTLLLGRANQLGNWRTMRGQWFTQAVIDDEWEDPDGFEAGWYETAVEPDAPNCWAIAPTHWQPLPARPAANGAGGLKGGA